MNERIRQLAEQAVKKVDNPFPGNPLNDELEKMYIPDCFAAKFAELIVKECTAVLFDQSEKLFELCSEETNMRTAQEYELCSNQCVNNIELIEKHFGVEE